MNKLKTIIFSIAAFLFFAITGIVLAVNITVPSAPGANYGLISTTTGAYIATTTGQITCTGNASCGTNSYVFGSPLTITDSGSSFSTTSANYWASLGLAFSTTSSNVWSAAGLGFSTTSANYWGSTKGYSTFSYPFPSNATSTALTFSGGLSAAGLFVNGISTNSLTNGAAIDYLNPNLRFSLPSTESYSWYNQGRGTNLLMSLNGSTGQLRLGQYGSGTIAGTAAYYLAEDSSGNVIEASVPTTAVTGTWPIISSGGTTPNITFGGLTTSTAAVLGNIPYFSGVNTFANVATSSAGAGTGLTFSGTAGAQVGGTGGTYSVNTTQNISTLSNLGSGFVGTNSGALYNFASSSVFGVLGAPGTVPMSSNGGVVWFATSTSGGSSFAFPFTPLLNFGVNTNSTTTPISFTEGIFSSTTSQFAKANFYGQVSIASTTSSTTPFGLLSVDTSTLGIFPAFVVGSSSATQLIVTNNGNFGVGTSSPFASFGFAQQPTMIGASNAGNAVGFFGANGFSTGITGGTGGGFIFNSGSGGNGSSSGGAAGAIAFTTGDGGSGTSVINANGGNFLVTTGKSGQAAGSGASGGSIIFNTGSGLTSNGVIEFEINNQEKARVDTTGNFGIGTTGPWGLLSVQPVALTTTGPAFVIGSSTRTLFETTQGGETKTCQTIGPGPGNTTATSTSMNIDWANTCPHILLQMGTSAFTITWFDATISPMNGSAKVVMICNPNDTAGAVTWAGVEWDGGTVPTQTTTKNQCDSWPMEVTAGTSTAPYTYKIDGHPIASGFQ